MSKLIYPTDGIWSEKAASELLPSDGIIPDGYTDIVPPTPNFKLKFENGVWVETATEEEIKAANTAPIPEPTDQDNFNAEIIQQIAALQIEK
jgi:hypothetical protein